MEQAELEQVVPERTKESGLSFKGIIQVLYKPTEFFEKLKYDPKVLVPYLALGLMIVIFFVSAGDLLVQATMQSEQFQQRLQGQAVPPNMAAIIKINIIIFGSLALLLAPLLVAALAYFWGTFVMAGRGGFKQLLSVSLYAEIIWAIGMLVTIPFMLLKGSPLFSFSLAILAAKAGPESLLYVALSKINLFLIWEIIVAGIGFSIIYNVARNKGYWISVLSVGLLSFIHVAWTGIAKLIM